VALSTQGTACQNADRSVQWLLQSGGPRFNSQNSCLLHCVQSDSGKRSFVCYGMGAVRRSGREADQSSLSAAYVSECGCISFHFEVVKLIHM